MAKARLRRKDLKQPDEFVTVTAHVARWIRSHRELALGAVVSILLVAMGGAAVAAYQSAQRRDANADLGRAMADLRAQATVETARALSEAGRRWSNTTPGVIAAALAANTELRLGNAESALTGFGELRSTAAALPPYLQQQLSYAGAAALEAQQRWADAAAGYEAAATLSGPYTALAVLGEARTRERAGDNDRARELYRRCYEQFPDLPGREAVRTKAGL